MGFGNVSSAKQSSATTSTINDSKTTGGDNSTNQGGSGNTNLNINGGELLGEKALTTVKDVVSNALDTQLSNRAYDSDLLKALGTNLSNNADKTVAELGNLAETKITDGANLNQKTTMVALAVAGAVVFFMRKK